MRLPIGARNTVIRKYTTEAERKQSHKAQQLKARQKVKLAKLCEQLLNKQPSSYNLIAEYWRFRLLVESYEKKLNSEFTKHNIKMGG